MKTRYVGRWIVGTGLAFFLLAAPARAIAHCDGVDGPVVKAAQRALDTKDPALALIWALHGVPSIHLMIGTALGVGLTALAVGSLAFGGLGISLCVGLGNGLGLLRPLVA